MKNQPTNLKKVILMSVFFSFMIHVGFLVSKYDVYSLIKNSEEEAPKKPQKIKLVFKDKAKVEKQIVNNIKQQNQEKPEDSKFLSHSNQRVDRQSVSKDIGSFKEAGLGSKTAMDMDQGGKNDKTPKKKVKKGKNKKISFSDLAFSKNPVKKNVMAQAKGLKNGNTNERGLSRANDFVEEIPLGDMTKLNTTEYKYYGFYFRIRQRLEQYWGNSIQEKAKKIMSSGRRVPASENHITSLRIVLDEKGNIVDIIVKSTSGIAELDEAAIESFNKAGPFPNPPKGLVKNGVATIEWGFVVKS